MASWALGVTLGVILGLALLIATPRLMATPQAVTTGAQAAEEDNGAPGSGTSRALDGESTASGEEGNTQGNDTANASGNSENTAQQNAGGEGENGTTTTASRDLGSSGDSSSNMDTGANPDSDNGPQPGVPNGGATAATEGTPDDSGTVDEQAPGNAESGQTIFASNCAGCHGAQAQGQIGPSLVTADGPKAWTLAQFTTTLREGRTPERELAPTMPRFSAQQLSDAQIADIQAWIKTQ